MLKCLLSVTHWTQGKGIFIPQQGEGAPLRPWGKALWCCETKRFSYRILCRETLMKVKSVLCRNVPASLKSDRKFLTGRVRTAKNQMNISKISFFLNCHWERCWCPHMGKDFGKVIGNPGKQKFCFTTICNLYVGTALSENKQYILLT